MSCAGRETFSPPRACVVDILETFSRFPRRRPEKYPRDTFLARKCTWETFYVNKCPWETFWDGEKYTLATFLFWKCPRGTFWNDKCLLETFFVVVLWGRRKCIWPRLGPPKMSFTPSTVFTVGVKTLFLHSKHILPESAKHILIDATDFSGCCSSLRRRRGKGRAKGRAKVFRCPMGYLGYGVLGFGWPMG